MTKEELANRIVETAILRGEFTLRSGKTSTWYIDKYLFTTQPDILLELGNLFSEELPDGTTVLAGAELGGIPLVTSASMACGLPCVFIRNQKKDYGTSKQLEGKLVSSDRVVIVEDIATTGGQVIEAATTIEGFGATVELIIAVVDRQEGARENIEEAGYKFVSLFTSASLGISEPCA
tara:strand:+ start:298 stop:831 length:534 start_codon:yes stop_codon:yes gene_type:complete